MSKREINPEKLAKDEDWAGNNAAFTCPVCSKVFLVSASKVIHKGVRECPSCGASKGHVTGGKQSGGKAWIEW